MPDLAGRRWLLVAAGLVVAQAMALHLMGQPWFSATGAIELWEGAVASPENSQQIADWYSLSHVVHGFLFYGLFWLILPRRVGFAARLALAIGIEMSWELFENTDFVIDRYRETTISLDYHGDSVLNSVFDTLWMTFGFTLASRLPWQATVGIALALELLAAWVIRDNLTLNILMLVHPSEAVRAWQAGG